MKPRLPKSARRILPQGMLLLIMMAACASPTVPEPEDSGAKVLQSGMARDIAPSVSSTEMHELTAGNRAFALDFYQAVRDQDGNLLFSPFSLSEALAMTYAGARGNTAAQMRETLHYTLPQERLHPAFHLYHHR